MDKPENFGFGTYGLYDEIDPDLALHMTTWLADGVRKLNLNLKDVGIEADPNVDEATAIRRVNVPISKKLLTDPKEFYEARRYFEWLIKHAETDDVSAAEPPVVEGQADVIGEASFDATVEIPQSRQETLPQPPPSPDADTV